MEMKMNQFENDTLLLLVAEDESLSTALMCIDYLKYISGLGMNTKWKYNY